ncbi:MAG: porin [Isosphaeraceae bacterium]|nr:porin [Isosphaeraceae bacterium]
MRRRMEWRAAATVLLLTGLSTVARGQSAGAPPTPSVAPPVGRSREVILEDRIRRLEEDNREMRELYKALAKQNEALAKRLEGSQPRPPAAEDSSVESFLGDDAVGPGSGLSPRAREGVGAQGTDARVFLPESESFGGEKLRKRKAVVEFGEGLEFGSDDGEFKLQFHDLTQAEYRSFSPIHSGDSFLKSQFFMPRQRWYFTGRVTKNIEFYTVINRGYGSLDLLDAFLTLRYDPRLRFRIGRMKTPYLYEYYEIAEGDLIAPERSMYAGNFAGNRQEGAMFLGELFQNRIGYAAGVFNGPRRSFGDTNNAKDLYLFLNSRPFLKPRDEGGVTGAQGTGGRTRPTQNLMSDNEGPREPGPFEYLNLGGSFNIGYEQNPLQPSILTTANDQTSSSNNSVVESLSPTFFAFNNNVVEFGERAQWSGHAAWYYKSLMMLAEYGGGFGGYALSNSHYSTRVPLQGFTVGPAYFLTGERLTRRVNVVKPRHDFRVRNGKVTGTGAIEVYARYSYLDIGKNVFTAGFADPNLWTNQAATTDIGVNWYLNFYTKIYFDWQHAMYGNPIATGSERFGKSQDLLWLRFQLFF